LVGPDAEITEHLRPPFFPHDVIVQCRRNDRRLRDEPAAEAVHQVILNQQVFVDAVENLRLVRPEPQNARGGPDRYDLGLPRALQDLPVVKEPINLLGFLDRPVIQPHDGLAQRPAILVDRNNGLTLAGERDRPNVFPVYTRLRQQITDDLDRRTPVNLRLHLAPDALRLQAVLPPGRG